MSKPSITHEFTKNFLKLVSGNLIVLGIPIFTAPVNSRLYLPADYGLLGVFLMFVGFFTAVSTSGFCHGMIVSSRKKDIANFFNLSVFSTYISVILSVIAVIISVHVNFIKENGLLFIIFVPVHVLLQSFIGILQTLINKHGRYGILTQGRVIASFSAASIQILFGFLGLGFKGLLITYIVSSLLTLFYYIFLFKREIRQTFKLISSQYSKTIMILNLKYIKYTTPSEIINTLIQQIPIYMFTKFFNAEQLGAYVFSERLLGMPFSVMSGAFTEIFRKNASEEMNRNNNCRESFNRTLKLLLIISLPIFIVIGIASPVLFDFVFGSRWILAGQIASALALMYASRFIVSPLTYVFILRGKQKEDFILHLLMPIWILAVLICLKLFGIDQIVPMMFFYSIGVSVIYILYFYKSYKYSR
jgi:O-antigen/teichoic acid export membrane protein